MYIHCKNSVTVDIGFLISETLESLRPSKTLTKTYEDAVTEFNQLTTISNASATNKSADTEAHNDASEVDDDEGDEEDDMDVDNRIDMENRMEADTRDRKGGFSSDSDDSEEESDSDDSEISQSGDDDGVIVHMPDDLARGEEDIAFEEEFSRMMQDSLETRKNERKVQSFDAPIPVKNKQTTQSVAKEEHDNDGVQFTLLTKRGNKQQVLNWLYLTKSFIIFNML
jgi:regulator of nonsense transcripts 2